MQYFVYILTNWSNSVLYIGITNDLMRRLAQHRAEVVDSFSKCYHTHKLIYFETTTDVRAALESEKQLKGWTRSKKTALIQTMNPKWLDLSSSWEYPRSSAGNEVPDVSVAPLRSFDCVMLRITPLRMTCLGRAGAKKTICTYFHPGKNMV